MPGASSRKCRANLGSRPMLTHAGCSDDAEKRSVCRCGFRHVHECRDGVSKRECAHASMPVSVHAHTQIPTQACIERDLEMAF